MATQSLRAACRKPAQLSWRSLAWLGKGFLDPRSTKVSHRYPTPCQHAASVPREGSLVGTGASAGQWTPAPSKCFRAGNVLAFPGLSLRRAGRSGRRSLLIPVVSGAWVMSGLSDAWDSL